MKAMLSWCRYLAFKDELKLLINRDSTDIDVRDVAFQHAENELDAWSLIM